MIRTIQILIPFDQAIIDTIKMYNQTTQYVINYGWEERTYNKNKLHNLTYNKVRRMYPQLQSSLVQCARDMASDMLKREKFQHRKPIKKTYSAIRYNQRTFSPFLKSNYLSISTVNGRKRYSIHIPSYFQKYVEGKVKSLTIGLKRKKRIIAYLGLELPDIDVRKNPRDFLGVDRGINRVVVLSNNLFYNSNHIKAVKWNYQRLRQELQSKGTRPAKRKLQNISRRERRFMTDLNYQIAKWIVSQPFDCIVLENLKGIKKRIRPKTLRKRSMNWAYYQLERFIIQKAEVVGKIVLFVHPNYTSQCCSRCGYIDPKNRAKQAIFKCKECGLELNADLNASRNISRLGTSVFGRASVNSPNVAYDEVKGSYKEQLRLSIATSHLL